MSISDINDRIIIEKQFIQKWENDIKKENGLTLIGQTKAFTYLQCAI